MTAITPRDAVRRMGRKKLWTERITLPLAGGTVEQIDRLLDDGEVRLDFIRSAIDREIRRRSKQARGPRDSEAAQS